MLNNTQTLAEALDAAKAKAERGPWFPACNGTEESFKHCCYRYLYMYQPSTRTHAYLCLDTDLFLDDDEADLLFGR